MEVSSVALNFLSLGSLKQRFPVSEANEHCDAASLISDFFEMLFLENLDVFDVLEVFEVFDDIDGGPLLGAGCWWGPGVLERRQLHLDVGM